MGRYIILAVLASLGSLYAKSEKHQVEITVVNGTAHDIRVALASDYNVYPVPGPGTNYINPTPAGPREATPWLTDWHTVKKGKTGRLTLDTPTSCPEYVIVDTKCALYGKPVTQFEGRSAILLTSQPKERGKYGPYQCTGNATVTLATRKKADKRNAQSACEADVTVADGLEQV